MPENPEVRARYRRKLRQRLRQDALEAYGGTPPKCACCAGTESLELDHIHGQGRVDREWMVRSAKETGFQVGDAGPYGYYKWATQHFDATTWQVLCRACNRSKSNGPACRLDHGATSA